MVFIVCSVWVRARGWVRWGNEFLWEDKTDKRPGQHQQAPHGEPSSVRQGKEAIRQTEGRACPQPHPMTRGRQTALRVHRLPTLTWPGITHPTTPPPPHPMGACEANKMAKHSEGTFMCGGRFRRFRFRYVWIESSTMHFLEILKCSRSSD